MTITPDLDTENAPQFAVCHIQQLPDEQSHDQPPTLSAVDAAAIADQITDAIKSAQRYDATAAFLLYDLPGLDRLLTGTDPQARQQLISDLAARLRTSVRDGDVVDLLDAHTLSLLVTDTHAADVHSTRPALAPCSRSPRARTPHYTKHRRRHD